MSRVRLDEEELEEVWEEDGTVVAGAVWVCNSVAVLDVHRDKGSPGVEVVDSDGRVVATVLPLALAVTLVLGTKLVAVTVLEKLADSEVAMVSETLADSEPVMGVATTVLGAELEVGVGVPVGEVRPPYTQPSPSGICLVHQYNIPYEARGYCKTH